MKKAILLLCICLSSIVSFAQSTPAGQQQADTYRPSERRLKAARAVNYDAEFDGDFGQFLSRSVRYPDEARAKGIAGKVVVQFTINKNGNLENIQVLSGPPELHESALNAIRRSDGRWIPGRQNNKFLDQIYTVPIRYAAPRK
ncbi:energy transducer TonB [Mucilaginibacter pedocola]|uniref:TonB C-terminal domain-containing protein n=1 Tax=Mucilaginibacter pedocola TaxID=1792845 RepID=A0A1S9PHG2_9SPHI|nr:energy transducer TonB [Mucilaginibacter pedocola]OOQ60383.1 hypothetical protein BC343_25520 [Mucilaginibacter pedocola]